MQLVSDYVLDKYDQAFQSEAVHGLVQVFLIDNILIYPGGIRNKSLFRHISQTNPVDR